MNGRRVILFKRRPGADRKLGTDRSRFRPRLGQGTWGMPSGTTPVPRHARVYAKVTREVRDRFVCRADRSRGIPGSY